MRVQVQVHNDKGRHNDDANFSWQLNKDMNGIGTGSAKTTLLDLLIDSMK